MNNQSRSQNSIKNIIMGTGNQFFVLLLTFIARTVFIKTLGEQFLGVNGLYTNILTVLSLAELGLGNVMLYSLYKPILEKDEKRISALLHYYKRLYTIIAFSVFLIGMCIYPFLDKILNSSLPMQDLKSYYVLFLMNSVFSYVSIYKSSLINADQKVYITKIATSVFLLIQNIIQVFVLFYTKNYYLYLIIQVCFTLLTNLWIGRKADKLYPFIQKNATLSEKEKKDIFSNMKSMLLYKVGTVIMNNTDNILISIIIGTVYVGYYSNYSMIIVAITNVILVMINAISPSIGNLNASEDQEKKYKIFNTLLMLFNWISSFCAICCLAIINNFVSIWAGPSYVLDTATMIVIIFNFYLANAINPVWMYRETLGLFHKIKYIMLICAIINIILSIILGEIFGVFGILFATFIAKMITVVWYEPRVLYHTVFKKSTKEYFKRQCKYFVIFMISTIIVLFVCQYIPGHTIVWLLAKIGICTIVVNGLFLFACKNTEEFTEIYDRIKEKLIRKKI